MDTRKFTDIKSMLNDILSERREYLYTYENPMMKLIGFQNDETEWVISSLEVVRRRLQEPVSCMFRTNSERAFLSSFLVAASQARRIDDFWECLDLWTRPKDPQ